MPPTASVLLVDPTAVVGRRIAAYVIDSIPMAVGLVLLVGLLFSGGTVIDGMADPEGFCDRINEKTYSTDYDPLVEKFDDDYICMPINETVRLVPIGRALAAFGYALLGGIFAVVNMYLVQGATGATLGKRICKLRVVTPDGQRVGFGRNALRSILLIADGFCLGIVGLVSVLSTKRHQRIGDMCAGTYVVHRDSVGFPVPQGFAMPGQTVPPQIGAEPSPGPTITPPMPPGSQMQWDDRWKAWVYWDPSMQRWLRHDTATNQWIVIPN